MEESGVANVGFSAPEDYKSLLDLLGVYNCMSGRGRGRGVLVVRPVRLPRSYPRVLHLAGHVNWLPGGVTRYQPPHTKGG